MNGAFNYTTGQEKNLLDYYELFGSVIGWHFGDRIKNGYARMLNWGKPQ